MTVERKITVVLRYDDFGAQSDTGLELRVLDRLRDHEVCAVFGVVPFTCEGGDGQSVTGLSRAKEKAGLLRSAVSAGLVEAALHGFCHEFFPLPQGGYTEFFGREAALQADMIERGLKELTACAGHSPVTFIPPFNSYDAETVQALVNSGIACLSASMFGPVIEDSRLSFFPQTCSLSQLRDSVMSARRGPDAQSLIMALFHQFDFEENDPDRGKWSMDGFAKLLSWLVSQPDVEVRTVADVVARGDDLCAARYAAQRRFLVASLYPWAAPVADIAPARLRLNETLTSEVLRRFVMTRTIRTYAFAALGAYAAGVLVARSDVLTLYLRIAPWVGAAALCVLFVLKKGAYFKGVLITIALCFLGLGMVST